MSDTSIILSSDGPHKPICFVSGTGIATPLGTRAIETLREGDKVITRDNGHQTVAWAGKRRISAQDLQLHPESRPILIKAGSIAPNTPETDLLVSPNHRMLICSSVTALAFDAHETLVAAKHLVGQPGISHAETGTVTYHHILFERHEVILGNGAWSESFQPGDYSMGTLKSAQREEVFRIFPELRERETLGMFVSARRILNKKEAVFLRTH